MPTHKWLRLMREVIGTKETLRFLKREWSRMCKAFFSVLHYEPGARRQLLSEYFTHELFMTLMCGIDYHLLLVPGVTISSPADDEYLSYRDEPIQSIDLNNERFNQLFAHAKIYRWQPLVWARQILRECYKAGEYEQLGLCYIEDKDKYRYSFKAPYLEPRMDGELELKYHKVQGELAEGDFLVHDPHLSISHLCDHRYAYFVINSRDFWQDYQVAGKTNLYRRRAMCRAIANPISSEIKAETVLGLRYGDKHCMILAPYIPQQPNNLAQGMRFPVAKWWFDLCLERAPGRR